MSPCTEVWHVLGHEGGGLEQRDDVRRGGVGAHLVGVEEGEGVELRRDDDDPLGADVHLAGVALPGKVHDAVVGDLVAKLLLGEGVDDGAPPEARGRVRRRVQVGLLLERAERPRTWTRFNSKFYIR